MDKKQAAALKIQEAFQQFSDELLNESGALSNQTKEEIEKLISQKLNDVDSALGKEKVENKRMMDDIHAKMLYLEKLVHGEFEKKREIEQNNQSKVTFANNFEFQPTAIKYNIGGQELVGQIHAGTGDITGPKIISGNFGIPGDGNQQGHVKFDGNLDQGTKITFLGKNKGISGQLEEIRAILREIQLSVKDSAQRITALEDKNKKLAEALK